MKEQELIPAAVLLTHHHHDHVGGAAKVADILDIPVMMSFEDSLMYKGKVDSYLQDGQILDLDGQPLMIRLTPGHTKGSLCIEAPQSRVVFTGDTIFDTEPGADRSGRRLSGGYGPLLRRGHRQMAGRIYDISRP